MIGTWKAKKDLGVSTVQCSKLRYEMMMKDWIQTSWIHVHAIFDLKTMPYINRATISDWRHLSLSSHQVILLIYLASQGTVWSNHWNRAKHLILPSGGLNMCQGWYQQQCDCQKNCFQGQEMKTAKMVHCMTISSLWM